MQQLTGKGTIKAYTLAHEGTTYPRSIGEGRTKFKWPRKVIEQLKDVVKPGTKFFSGHNADNSTKDRKAIGEVVTTTLKEYSGKLHNIVVGFFPEDNYTDDLDVISMEANVEVDPQDVSLVDRITKFTGIAAASSKYEQPAFAGARLEAALQCFEEPNPGEGKEKVVTFDEVKKAVKDMNIYPHQLYSKEDVQGDRELGKLFDDVSTKDAEIERLTKENEELNKTNKDSIRKTEIDGAKKALDEITKEGYTDNQKAFIKKGFKPELMESLDEKSLKGYVDNATKEFSELAKMFGAEESDDSDKDKSGDGDKTDDPVEAALKQLEE